MKGYIENIEKITKDNNNFRRVLYTAKHSQLVVMSLNPKEDIGEEIHNLDQFIKIEAGSGKVVLNDVSYDVSEGYAVVVPKGAKHNIINTGDVDMKLYSVYSPPNHHDGIVHKNKLEAIKDEDEHFDGKTTE